MLEGLGQDHSTMNTAAKGRRLEHKSGELLEAAGYRVTRSSRSLGTFDLIGISSSDIVLCQVKANAVPSPAEREEIREFPAPTSARKLIHVWKDRARLPRVIEL